MIMIMVMVMVMIIIMIRITIMITIMFRFRLRYDYGFNLGYFMVPKHYVSFSKHYAMNILWFKKLYVIITLWLRVIYVFFGQHFYFVRITVLNTRQAIKYIDDFKETCKEIY